MTSFLRVLRDFALLMARVVLGVTLLARGWHRWQVVGIPQEVALLEQAGIPYATTLIWLVIGFEVIGGVLLVFGLATPLVGLGVLALNLGVIILLRGPDGAFFVHEHGWEYNALMAVMGLVLMTHGSGRAGLDNLFLRPKDDHGDLIVDDSDVDRVRERDF